MSHTLKPAAEPYSAEAAAILAQYPQRDGYLLQLFRVFANSLRFLRKGTVNLLDRDSPLPTRLRELVILRVCANNDCEYEWGVHVGAFAEHVSLSPAQVAATRLGPADAACWDADEQILLRAVDQLCRSGRLAPDTQAAFQRRWNVEQQLEILALCGNYHTICFVANTAELEPETFAARFPKPAATLSGSSPGRGPE